MYQVKINPVRQSCKPEKIKKAISTDISHYPVAKNSTPLKKIIRIVKGHMSSREYSSKLKIHFVRKHTRLHSAIKSLY